MNYVDFTSLPPEDEAKFVVYEQRTQEAAAKAIKIGAITAAIIGVLVIIVVFSYDKPKNLMADDDIGMLADDEDRAQQRSDLNQAASTPTPAAPKSETPPEGGTPAEGGATAPTEGGATAPAEGGASAPAEGGAAAPEAGGAAEAPATP